jgi:hypothetical protein
MNLEELREATKEYDEEFVADRAKPLSAKNRARWKRIQAKLKREAESANGEEVIEVQIDKKLLRHCTALAKKKRISRDALIARGIKAILAVEGK